MNDEFYIPTGRVDHIIQVLIDQPPVLSPHYVYGEIIKETVGLWETFEFESEFRERRG